MRFEAIEYVSLATAISMARRNDFVMAELGAGWAPRVTTSSKMAAIIGKNDFYAVAVEACGPRIALLKEHLTRNGLNPDTCSNIRVLEGAAWYEDTVLYFPKISADDDYGAAASTTGDGKDYRDLDLEHEQIKAFSLEEILRERPVFDYVHVDIQGAELPLIENALDTIKRKVKTLFIGTHSRHIESELVKILRSNGFRIKCEKPCRVNWGIDKEDLTALTSYDGAQFWINEAL